MEQAQQRTGTTWVWWLVVLTLIWGSSFMLIKVALVDFDPLQVALGRVVVGTLTLLAIVAATRQQLPRDRRLWVSCAGIGLLTNALPFSLVAIGEQHVSSVQAGIWNATTPLCVLLILLALRTEPLTPTRITGLLLGFSGVVLVLAPWAGVGEGERTGHLALAAMAACYGISTVWIRRAYRDVTVSAEVLAGTQLLCATGWLLLLTLPFEGVPEHAPGPRSILSVLVLGAFGTGIAYVLFTKLIREVGSATAASVTYLMPIVSTLLGVLVLDEGIGWHEPVGAAVILLGVFATARVPGRVQQLP